MQFSLRWLLLGVAFVAVSVVALLNANQLWASAAKSVVVALLSFALVGSVFSRGNARAFWTGFAIFGIVRLILSGLVFRPLFTFLLGDEVVHRLYMIVVDDPVQQGQYGADNLAGWTSAPPPFDHYAAVGRVIVVIVVAMVGGLLSMCVYRRNKAST